MNADSRSLEALNAALDARRDPLTDPALLAALEADPEAYAGVERMLAGIAALERLPVAPDTSPLASAAAKLAPTPGARLAPCGSSPAARIASPAARIASLAAGAVLAIGMGLLAASMPERGGAPTGGAPSAIASSGVATIGVASAWGGELLEYHVSIARSTPIEERVLFNDNGRVTRERLYSETDTYTGSRTASASPDATFLRTTVTHHRR